MTPHQIASNLRVKELPDTAFSKLDGLERQKRFEFPARWGFDIFEEVGDAKVKEVAKKSGPQNKVKSTA